MDRIAQMLGQSGRLQTVCQQLGERRTADTSTKLWKACRTSIALLTALVLRVLSALLMDSRPRISEAG